MKNFLNLKEMGQQETDVIKILKTDHRKVEGLFAEFESATTKNEKVKLINQIVKELSVHTAAEEKLVYPIVETEDEDLGKEAIEEHHAVKLMLAELADYDGSEDNAEAKVKVLCEMVKHHVKEEEKKLLPKLKQSGADLDELGEAVLAEKQQLMNKMQKIGDKSKRQVGCSPVKTSKSKLAS